jgi:hypothetical protein
MKHTEINNSKENKIFFKKGKLKIFITIIMLLIFFIFGSWSEKYDLIEKPRELSKHFFFKIQDLVISNFSKAEKIVIDIKYKNYQTIKDNRDFGLKNIRLQDDDVQWVKAKLSTNNSSSKIKIRLKGTHADHWSHPYKWSFKIKTVDKSRIFGLKNFSIQPPNTTSYLNEWLFMKALKKENLISHRIKFIDVIFNGDNYGVYTLIENASKELIENNNRREGPIISFNKDFWIEEMNNSNNISVNDPIQNFWRSKIMPVKFEEKLIGTEQEIYLNKAIFLLESFRNNKLEPDEVFDTDQLSKLMAIRAIFGSAEFDTNDLKFYFNPVTNLLEPISREIHSVHKIFYHYSSWLFDTENLATPWHKHFLNLLYKNKKFKEKFYKELGRLTNQSYIDLLIKENKVEFEKNKKILNMNYPIEEIFSLDDYQKTKEFIKNSLDPLKSINANLHNLDENEITINTSNINSLPVEIIGIKFGPSNEIKFKKYIYLEGSKKDTSSKQNLIKIKCTIIKCNKSDIENYKLIYKILGQKKLNYSSIDFWSNSQKFDTFQSKKDNIKNLKNFKFVEITGNKIIFKEGNIIIKDKIIIPENYNLIINTKTKITFKEDGSIISFSPIFINGEDVNPVIIQAEPGNSKNGNSLLIINTKKQSKINNAIFTNLSSPTLESGRGLMGSLNFYQSDVEIQNTRFSNNSFGDDYLNIIRSNFIIKNSYFENTYSDALDVDFSNGVILNTIFDKSGNDAIDFSGSNVKLENININQAGDKAISVGEKSKVDIKGINISNSKIGLASKDNSNLKVKNIVINNIDIGAAAYIKKAEYGPATIKIEGIKISNFRKKYISQKKSEIIVNNIPIENYNCKNNKNDCYFLNN